MYGGVFSRCMAAACRLSRCMAGSRPDVWRGLVPRLLAWSTRQVAALQPRKRIRLDPAAYAEVGRVCAITIAVRDRARVFADPTVAASVVAVLREHAERTGVSIHAFCVMPDHVHLVAGPSARCDLITFVGQFKNLAQRAAWARGVKGRFWQPGFWDHFVRRDEDLRRVIEYVLDNPVRAGLVAVRDDYPFAASPSFQSREDEPCPESG